MCGRVGRGFLSLRDPDCVRATTRRQLSSAMVQAPLRASMVSMVSITPQSRPDRRPASRNGGSGRACPGRGPVRSRRCHAGRWTRSPGSAARPTGCVLSSSSSPPSATLTSPAAAGAGVGRRRAPIPERQVLAPEGRRSPRSVCLRTRVGRPRPSMTLCPAPREPGHIAPIGASAPLQWRHGTRPASLARRAARRRRGDRDAR